MSDEEYGYNWAVLGVIGLIGGALCGVIYQRGVHPMFLLTVPASIWPIAKYGFHWHKHVPVEEEPEEMGEHVTDWKKVVQRHDDCD